MNPAVAIAVAQYEKQAKEEATTTLTRAADQASYDALNFHDDQFDLSDALIAIAISLLAITSLTQLWWLYGLSLYRRAGHFIRPC